MKRLARCLFLFFVLFLALAMAGCETVPAGEQGPDDTKAWNTPAGWEGQMIGVPY